MKIVVLVKQVPRLGAIEFDEETRTLKREGVPLELNMFDGYAVQHAAALGGEVVAMTMGPPQAEEALRECFALGADRAIHLSDRVFAVADTIGTSRTLALAIQKESADLVLCGRKALDSETWQVPPEVAAFLGWPHVTNASGLEVAEETKLRITRETDFGDELFEAELPVVVSLGKPPGAEPARGSPDGPVTVWTASDLVDEVREDDKRFGQTGSPTRVLAVRDSRPERRQLAIAGVDEAARTVLELLDERRPEEPPWEKPDHIAEKPGAHYDCWSVVELARGKPRRVSLELVARSRHLAGKLGGRQISVVLGAGAEAVAEELGRHGAEVVYTAEALGEYHPELWAYAVRVVLEQHRPHVLLIPATGRGRDFGPRAAGELELGMTADCVGVDISRAGRLLQQKPAYGGNIVSVIMGATTPQLSTVLPRMYEPLHPGDNPGLEVRPLDLGPLPEPRVRLLERSEDRDSYLIDEADIVTLLGPGLGGPEAIPRIQAEAAAVGAEVAGTREVCEAGWLEPTRRVGLLGRPVAPRLLVAVGVDGDEEQSGGFVKAGVVVAVGADEGAPIRELADVVVEGDWRETLKPLHDAIAAGL